MLKFQKIHDILTETGRSGRAYRVNLDAVYGGIEMGVDYVGFDYGGSSMGTGGFEAMFMIVFVIIVGAFAVTAVKSISTWNRNNHSPRLSVSATVVSKRIAVTHHHYTNAADASAVSAATGYYVTFQVESGDRMEFSVNGLEYGMLAEGDQGELSFQGTRYLSFERGKGVHTWQ